MDSAVVVEPTKVSMAALLVSENILKSFRGSETEIARYLVQESASQGKPIVSSLKLEALRIPLLTL